MTSLSARRRSTGAALAAAGLLLVACGSDPSTADGPADARENAAARQPEACLDCAVLGADKALTLTREVTVIEVLVKPGDTVTPGQPLLTIEDHATKAVIDLESSGSLVVGSINVKAGDKLPAGRAVISFS